MRTFVITDAAGNALRRETPVSDAIRPTTWPGETATLLVEPDPEPEPELDAEPAANAAPFVFPAESEADLA